MTFAHALIVDDDPAFQEEAKNLIQAAGIETTESALDGLEALEVLNQQQHKIDIIFCGLNMPNMDGVAFIRELGKLNYTGGFVIVSSEDLYLTEAIKRLARIQKIDVLGTIEKPISQDALSSVFNTKSAINLGAKNTNQSSSVWSGKRVNQYIDEQRFLPFYQPKLSLISKKVESVEILGRILGDNGEYEAPMHFLDAAESTGAITRATEVLSEQVATDLAKWQEQGRHLKASLNLSPLSLSDVQLPDRLETIFKKHNVDRRLITLEVTENKVMSYGADMLDVLARLRLKGFRLSLDDFGTGAASIEQLRLYPFNEIKIDQSFIKDVIDNPFSRIAVETALKIAQQLDLRIVAEGIESKSALRYMRKLGVDEVQGFLISRPMTADAFHRWILDINAKNKSMQKIPPAA